MTDPLNFEEELARLEQIVRQLEGDELELGEALALFEEGVERVRRARARLKDAELKVKELGDSLT